MASDESRRPKLYGTNPPERGNGKIRQRPSVAGISPNREAVPRLVGARMLQQNDEWAISHRHMPVERLTALCTDPDAAAIFAAK